MMLSKFTATEFVCAMQSEMGNHSGRLSGTVETEDHVSLVRRTRSQVVAMSHHAAPPTRLPAPTDRSGAARQHRTTGRRAGGQRSFSGRARAPRRGALLAQAAARAAGNTAGVRRRPVSSVRVARFRFHGAQPRGASAGAVAIRSGGRRLRSLHGAAVAWPSRLQQRTC